MSKTILFISSVQKELAAEHRAVRDFVRSDPLLRRFFDVFLFEDLPASDRRADKVYLHEVDRCGLYVGLFGLEYGVEDRQGLSPTEHEFNRATANAKARIIFVKGVNDEGRHPRMAKLIREAGQQLIRRRFTGIPDLTAALYASLVDFLAAKELLRLGPFDAAVCPDAVMDDLSADKIQRFVGIARHARGFPLAEDTAPAQVLKHLHLLNNGRPANAAILLFGAEPQRFLISSKIKCAHFHGTEAQKPIPFYQVYKGTAFDLVDQAVDFVLSKINLAVGTREHSTQAPVAYEMPPEVVREAIVNAVAHRDYTSNGSVQVMLFSDRLEVWNPGTLPPSLTLEKLRHPHGSVPWNPLLAEPLYLTKYIERMGTGTEDMITRCRKAGLAEPEFSLTDGFVATIRRKPERAFEAVGGQVTTMRPESQPESVSATGEVAGEVTGEVRKLLMICRDAITRKKLQEALLLKGEENFRKLYLVPALKAGYIEMTIPDKPNSRLQKYRLTDAGRAWLARKNS